MRRDLARITLALAGCVALAAVSPARALVVAPPPGPQRVAQADAVVIGRVVGIEPQDIALPAAPGLPNGMFRVAVVNVAESIRGAKDAKMIRLAFLAPQNPPPKKGPILIRPGIRGVVPTVGLEGLFFLTKHPTENLYLAPNYYDVVASGQNNENFQREAEQARKAAKVLDNPLEHLKGNNAEDRLLAASMLLSKYRNPRGGASKTEPIDAQESKLILKAILEGNWNQPRQFGKVGPYELFSQLGLSAKDGWAPKGAKSLQDFQRLAQEWLRTNWETYRIQRYVPQAQANKK